MVLLSWALMLQLAAAAPAAPAGVADAFGAPLADAVLDAERGGDGMDWTQIGWIQEWATMNGNIVYSSVNGANSMGEGALSGVSGIATVIQNSGNQVIIQNALVLNLTLE